MYEPMLTDGTLL